MNVEYRQFRWECTSAGNDAKDTMCEVGVRTRRGGSQIGGGRCNCLCKKINWLGACYNCQLQRRKGENLYELTTETEVILKGPVPSRTEAAVNAAVFTASTIRLGNSLKALAGKEAATRAGVEAAGTSAAVIGEYMSGKNLWNWLSDIVAPATAETPGTNLLDWWFGQWRNFGDAVHMTVWTHAGTEVVACECSQHEKCTSESEQTHITKP